MYEEVLDGFDFSNGFAVDVFLSRVTPRQMISDTQPGSPSERVSLGWDVSFEGEQDILTLVHVHVHS